WLIDKTLLIAALRRLNLLVFKDRVSRRLGGLWILAPHKMQSELYRFLFAYTRRIWMLNGAAFFRDCKK
ncbi:MAG: hypothetical protein ACXVJ0_10665, partial [Candidatus Angelobacter sp.]